MNEVHTHYTVPRQYFEGFNVSGLRANPNTVLEKTKNQS